MKSIEIDRTKRLREEPHTGHNRWHPDIPPIVEVAPLHISVSHGSQPRVVKESNPLLTNNLAR